MSVSEAQFPFAILAHYFLGRHFRNSIRIIQIVEHHYKRIGKSVRIYHIYTKHHSFLFFRSLNVLLKQISHYAFRKYRAVVFMGYGADVCAVIMCVKGI